MRYLVYGAGTMGTVYACLLSQAHEVDLLVRRGRLEKISKGVAVAAKDLRGSGSYKESIFYPRCVTEISGRYDGVLVAVNRVQLKESFVENKTLAFKIFYLVRS